MLVADWAHAGLVPAYLRSKVPQPGVAYVFRIHAARPLPEPDHLDGLHRRHRDAERARVGGAHVLDAAITMRRAMKRWVRECGVSRQMPRGPGRKPGGTVKMACVSRAPMRPNISPQIWPAMGGRR